MASPTRRPTWQTARRPVQVVSLALFVVLTVAVPWLGIDWLPAQLFSRLDPLVGLTVVIAARAWVSYAAAGLIVLLATVILGRVWCGWVCPLGTLLDVTPSRRRGARRVPGLLRFAKYGLLAVIVGAAAFGTLSPMILDPVTIAMRPLQELLMPFLGSSALGQSAGRALSRSAIGMLAILSLLPLAVAVGLNAVSQRFWCRSLCPLGALLGLVALLPGARRRVDAATCTSCGRCARNCPTSAVVRSEAFASRQTECIACMTCVDGCETDSIAFTVGTRPALAPTFDADRRAAVVLLGGTGLIMAGALVVPKVASAGEIMRPPSTDEDRLAERCVGCGACYSACPTGALHPSLSVTSKSGLWTPMLYERPAHCGMHCNLCATVCPTDALHTPTPIEAAMLDLGVVAHIARPNCIAWAKGKSCLKCRNGCPIVGAIYATKERVMTRFDGVREVWVPHVDESLCIGCGVCVTDCPGGSATITISY